MKIIRDFLNPVDYRNYRNIRAVSILFVILGALYAFAGIMVLMVKPPNPDTLPLPIAVGSIITIVGLSGFVGGIAVLNGSRRWSKLAYVLAIIYLFAIPLGTILGVVMLMGLSRYLMDVQRFRDQTAPSKTG